LFCFLKIKNAKKKSGTHKHNEMQGAEEVKRSMQKFFLTKIAAILVNTFYFRFIILI